MEVYKRSRRLLYIGIIGCLLYVISIGNLWMMSGLLLASRRFRG